MEGINTRTLLWGMLKGDAYGVDKWRMQSLKDSKQEEIPSASLQKAPEPNPSLPPAPLWVAQNIQIGFLCNESRLTKTEDCDHTRKGSLEDKSNLKPSKNIQMGPT